MSTINNSENDNQSSGREGRPQIKINRKMRMWNKYKNYCLIGGGALAAIVLIVVIVSVLPKSSPKNPINNQTENNTQDYVAQGGTDAETDSSSETQGTESTGATQAETPIATQTQAPSTEAPTQTTVTVPATEAFTTKAKFDGAVFVGDTVINGMSYYKYLDSAQVISDTNMVSAQAAGKVNSVMATNPSKVFIMVGLNDANYGTRTTDYVVENIEKFVAAVKAKNSSTKVYVLSVTPITKAFESKANIKITQSFLNELNYKLSTKASSMGATYIDVATSFKGSDGYMFTECSGTGSNLKKDYYPYLLNRIASSL